jgi:serine phosphatase RsbU (regulator of sigma subunit)
MFTDGVTEARSAGDDEYGEERVLAQIAALRGSGAREIASSIYEDLERFMGVAPAADDVTLVVAHRSMTA